jgi:mono/diheme cytochrome c family protein
MKIRKLILVASLFLAVGLAREGSLIHQAPPGTAALSNPLRGQERARRAGAKLFARECASCHGANGAGGLGKAPPLRQKEVYEAAPGALFWVLRNGSLQRGMPSFAHLPEPQRWQIIAWLTASQSQ